MVDAGPFTPLADIALQEIIEGKIALEEEEAAAE
jgi:DNA-directed RNA polymerase subunit K/omega